MVARPFYGVMALAILTPVTSAMKSGLLIPHLRPSQALIIWLAPLVILCARRPVRGWSLLEWLGLAYALGTLVLGSFDLWRQSFPFSSSNIDALLGPFQYLLLLRATRVGVRTERELCLVVRALLLTALPVCALALMQGFGVTWAQNLAHTVTGVDEGHLDRAIGLFTNWQVLAGYLISVGLIAVAVAAYGARSILPTRRATWLAVIIGLLIGQDPDHRRICRVAHRQRRTSDDEWPRRAHGKTRLDPLRCRARGRGAGPGGPLPPGVHPPRPAMPATASFRTPSLIASTIGRGNIYQRLPVAGSQASDRAFRPMSPGSSPIRSTSRSCFEADSCCWVFMPL